MRKVPARGESGEQQAGRTHRQSQTVPSDAAVQERAATDASELQGSSPHERVPELVPAEWLDRLLAASIELPLAEGERAVAEAMVDAVAAILPGYAIGACIVPEPDGKWHDQLVVRRLAEGEPEAPAGVDPTRVFPWVMHEHVAPLAGSTTGSTLHVASDADVLDRDGSPAVHLVDRAAAVLGRALVHARRLALATGTQQDTRALEARMIQADKLATFGQLAAGVVHELNNPLTSIVAYSDYLIRKALAPAAPPPPEDMPPPSPWSAHLGDPDDVERLRRISESANRMLRFTRDLVSYARPSSGVAGPVVLHGVIDQAIAFCEHVLAAASMRVERLYGADVLAVRGVSEHLVQVFVNLLTNASQAATPSGGRVTVATSFDAGTRRVRILVEDDGTGIAPEHLTQVFVPFFTTKGDRHGTGLGLSIVKSIVESHDGVIVVESHAGRGTRFQLDLPAWQRG
jgi:signal transduction histidine kinase